VDSEDSSEEDQEIDYDEDGDIKIFRGLTLDKKIHGSEVLLEEGNEKGLNCYSDYMQTLDENFATKKPKKQVMLLLKAMKHEKSKVEENNLKINILKKEF